MRKRVVALVIGCAALVATVVMLPPRAISLEATSDIPEPVRGVVHVHTIRSDGSGTIDQVAEAAARAHLKFVVLTDHGDGTREPEPPSYRHGVLCIDAVEVTTFGGHLVVLGLTSPAPYPLGGEPRDVVEDVARLGAMSIAAHPVSEKPALRWNGWNAQPDGLEWLNADSEWRDERVGSLARAFVTYPWRRSETLATLLDRPTDALRTWDRLTQERRVVALAAHDAHANIGISLSRSDANRSSIALPGYEHIFRTFSIALPQLQLTGDATADAQAVVREIRGGHVYSSIDALAAPARLTFTASSGGRTAGPGDELPLGGSVSIRAQTTAPAGSRITLLANGRPVKSSAGPALTHEAPAERAAYRVEVRLPGVASDESALPWLLSNPIYIGRFEAASPTPWKPRDTLMQYSGGAPQPDRWGIEKNRESQGVLDFVKDPTPGTRLLLRYALSGSTAVAEHAWVGLGMLSGPGLARYDRLMFTGRADQPMRLWVQLWRPIPTGNQYWRRSVYLDPTDREIVVRFDDMLPVDEASATPPLSDVKSIMFVIDETNTPLGRGGKVWLDNVRYAR